MENNTPVPQPDTQPNNNEQTWAALTHLSALTVFITGIGIILGPLIMWMIKKDEMPFVDQEGKEALNFNISWCIWMTLAAISIVLLVGLILVPVLFVIWLILVIVAATSASNGKGYRYPLTIRFIK